jgi:hypothetical protein
MNSQLFCTCADDRKHGQETIVKTVAFSFGRINDDADMNVRLPVDFLKLLDLCGPAVADRGAKERGMPWSESPPFIPRNTAPTGALRF